MVKLLHGDCLDILKTLDENSIDSVVTDPPFHLTSIVKRYSKSDLNGDGTNEVRAKNRSDAYARYSRGFLGKEWDGGDIAFNKELWKLVHRTLKPGGFLLAFGATRNHHRMVCAIEDAGFEIRDMIGWLFAVGMPMSHNLTGEYQGYGTGLKPAFSPIVLARKSLAEKSVLENMKKYNTGALNIDKCRIEGNVKKWETPKGGFWKTDSDAKSKLIDNPLGRWPANLITTDIDESWTKYFFSAKANKADKNEGVEYLISWEAVDLNQENQFLISHLKDTSEDIIQNLKDKEWSMILSGKNIMGLFQRDMMFIIKTILNMITELKILNYSPNWNTRDCILNAIRIITTNGLSLAKSVDFIRELKQNTTNEKTESALGAVDVVLQTLLKIKEKGKQGNIHSTVKPTALMQYLCRLVTPPKGIVLDPFMGSGSTGKAAVLEGFEFIGIEKELEYLKIAEARIQIKNTLDQFLS